MNRWYLAGMLLILMPLWVSAAVIGSREGFAEAVKFVLFFLGAACIFGGAIGLAVLCFAKGAGA